MVKQIEFSLRPRSRGFHSITDEMLSHIDALPETGVLSLYIKHTSAGIMINEDADPDVKIDFESVYNHIVPENLSFLIHKIEGPDDMPAHIKTSMVGTSVSIPITNHSLNMGTWQGIFLCEFRNNGGSRKIVASIYS